jgi:hypothetical protein
MASQAKLAYGMKRCLLCGGLKPASEFYRNSAQKDGLQSWCKPCIKETYSPEYQHDYYMDNRDVLLPRHNESALRHYYKVTIIGDKAKLAEAVNQIWAEAVIAKGEERDGESKTRRNSGKTSEMG